MASPRRFAPTPFLQKRGIVRSCATQRRALARERRVRRLMRAI